MNVTCPGGHLVQAARGGYQPRGYFRRYNPPSRGGFKGPRSDSVDNSAYEEERSRLGNYKQSFERPRSRRGNFQGNYRRRRFEDEYDSSDSRFVQTYDRERFGRVYRRGGRPRYRQPRPSESHDDRSTGPDSQYYRYKTEKSEHDSRGNAQEEDQKPKKYKRKGRKYSNKRGSKKDEKEGESQEPSVEDQKDASEVKKVEKVEYAEKEKQASGDEIDKKEPIVAVSEEMTAGDSFKDSLGNTVEPKKEDSDAQVEASAA